jgi:protein kinase-like protein
VRRGQDLPLAGGGAAKAGNRFERRWTVSALLDVLEGDAESLQIEVPGPAGAGAEFRVIVDGFTTWHQAKRQRQRRGEWTVANLAGERVLDTWWDKIRRGDRFVFVSGTSADELRELIDRATTAESWEEFDRNWLGKELREAFDRLREHWGGLSSEELYHGLANIEVRVIDEQGLAADNERRLSTLVSGDPAVAAALLERFVDDALHRRLTAEGTWAMLAQHDVHPALAPGSVVIAGHPAPADRAARVTEWRGGAEVTVADVSYLLHEHFLAEDVVPDGSFVRQARALRLGPKPRRGGPYVWMRQVELRPGPPAPSRDRLDALARERRLLDELGPASGVPQVAGYVATGHAATLVVSWLASRDGTRPCDGLDTMLGDPVADPWSLSRLLSGCAGLARSLGRLHRHGVSHRDLTPSGIVMLDDGRFVLRDLGLAARAPRSGEGPADYQAPEQRRRGRHGPGPASDVYQLAALVYHLVTGRPPRTTDPLPIARSAPDLLLDTARVLDAALTSEPEQRPDLGALGAALRAGSRAPVQRSTHALPSGPTAGTDDACAGPRPLGKDAP